MALFEREGLAGIHLSSMGAYKAPDVEFLQHYPHVRAVAVSEAASLDLSGLRHLRHLRALSLPADRQGIGPDRAIGLRQFQELEEFGGEWSPKLELGSDVLRLKTLHLWKYRSKTNDLTGFPELPSLQKLTLLQAGMTHLEGAGRLRNLRELEFYACRRLVSVEGIAALADSPLERLTLERCRQVADYRALASLRRLKSLALVTGADIPSLEFLSGCSRLEGFGFFETNVVDGDLTPLLRHPSLTFVGSLDKRHYSHRVAEINQALTARATSLPVENGRGATRTDHPTPG